MKHIPSIVFFCIILQSCSNSLRIDNGTLSVTFDSKTALVSVKDLRSGHIWEQKDGAVNCISAKKDGNGIEAEVGGDFPFSFTLTLDGASLHYRISADAGAPMSEDLEFPSAFRTTDRNSYILETDGEGIMLPVTDTSYPYGDGITYFCGGGLSMSWKGMVDSEIQGGYQAVLETPYDACLRTFVQQDSLVSFKTVWLPSMQKFSYDRELSFNFFDKGGYVAQCGKYREYIWKKNGIIELKTQKESYPVIDRMVGSARAIIWDDGRDFSMLKEMKDAGVERLTVLWDSNHMPYPVPGFDDKVRSLGYASGGYELFTDLHKRDTAVYYFDFNGPLRHKHAVYIGDFEKLAARKADGSTYSNQFGTYACPSVMIPYIDRKLDRKMKEYPHEFIMMDVYQANGLYECYAPDHSVDRKGYAENIVNNFRHVRERYNVAVGSEWGSDFALPYTVFNEGMMTLQRPWWNDEINDPESPYYYGDWHNNERPSIMVTNCPASPTYHRYCLNEALRVPLFQLVYHDAVISTWRWEDGNSRNPEIWWKKDLYNMLYGTQPYWSLDRALWEKHRDTYVASSATLLPWLRSIGYDRMTDHRFLTPDGKVQQSFFSSGKSIIVNFSDNDCKFEDRSIGARSFLIIE